ncbi:MAG TPA: hypothetical protein VMG10_35340 [Gemmataceae bacterium]|nr:hypothetical protein [Gemmataceae bacterium]
MSTQPSACAELTGEDEQDVVYGDPQAGDYASQQAFGPADAIAPLAAPAAAVRIADLLT